MGGHEVGVGGASWGSTAPQWKLTKKKRREGVLETCVLAHSWGSIHDRAGLSLQEGPWPPAFPPWGVPLTLS